MKLTEVQEILAKSSQEDWIVDDESGSFTFKNDLNLHIDRADYDSFRVFNEPWATSHQGNRIKLLKDCRKMVKDNVFCPCSLI